MPLLAIPVGFALHEDASLAILTFVIIACWIFFRFPLKARYTGLLFGLIFVFLLPFAAAEIRYSGVVSKGLKKFISKPSRETPKTFEFYSPQKVLDVFGRVLFTAPTSFAEAHFLYLEPPPPLWSPIPQIFIVLVFGTSIMIFRYLNFKEKKMLIVSWVFLGSFIGGLYLYHFVFHANFYQHYYTVIYPVVVIFVSLVLYYFFSRSAIYKIAVIVILTVYVAVNVNALTGSEIKYSLCDKIELVKKTFSVIGNDDFAIYASGDPYIHGGGWTELYTLYFKPAVKSYHYTYWEWIYMAYSLFPVRLQAEDPAKIVVIHLTNEKILSKIPSIFTHIYKDYEIEVLDNSSGVIPGTITTVMIVPE